MWLITTRGMFSAVQHDDDTNLLVVRTRVYDDAVHLAQAVNDADEDFGRGETPAEVISYRSSDYPFRVILTRAEWTWFATLAASEVDYGNFKSAVAARQGHDREHVYHGVWSALLGLSRLKGALGTAAQRADTLREAPSRSWPLERTAAWGRPLTSALPFGYFDDERNADEPADDAPEAEWDAYYENDRDCTGCKHRHPGDCLGDCDQCTNPDLFTDRDIARQEARS